MHPGENPTKQEISKLSPTKIHFESPQKRNKNIMEVNWVLDGLEPMDLNTSLED